MADPVAACSEEELASAVPAVACLEEGLAFAVPVVVVACVVEFHGVEVMEVYFADCR